MPAGLDGCMYSARILLDFPSSGFKRLLLRLTITKWTSRHLFCSPARLETWIFSTSTACWDNLASDYDEQLCPPGDQFCGLRRINLLNFGRLFRFEVQMTNLSEQYVLHTGNQTGRTGGIIKNEQLQHLPRWVGKVGWFVTLSDFHCVCLNSKVFFCKV